MAEQNVRRDKPASQAAQPTDLNARTELTNIARDASGANPGAFNEASFDGANMASKRMVVEVAQYLREHQNSQSETALKVVLKNAGLSDHQINNVEQLARLGFPNYEAPPSNSAVPPAELRPLEAGQARPAASTPGQVQDNVTASAPPWLQADMRQHAKWLPADVRQAGLDASYEKQMKSLPQDVQNSIKQMNIPPWMVALMPSDPAKRDESIKQIRFMAQPNGAPPNGSIAQRAEQLLHFAGAAKLPTPEGLGDEGCTTSISHYVLAQLKQEFPQLATMPDQLTRTEYSGELQHLFEKMSSTNPDIVQVIRKPLTSLKPEDIQAGDLMIAIKPGGTHVFGWTRVPQGWNWNPGDKMAIGNTGLPQFGEPGMNLAQEYLSNDPRGAHNEHGPFNSTQVVFDRYGKPALSDPRTNIYFVQGSQCVIIRFRS